MLLQGLIGAEPDYLHCIILAISYSDFTLHNVEEIVAILIQTVRGTLLECHINESLQIVNPNIPNRFLIMIVLILRQSFQSMTLDTKSTLNPLSA